MDSLWILWDSLAFTRIYRDFEDCLIKGRFSWILWDYLKFLGEISLNSTKFLGFFWDLQGIYRDFCVLGFWSLFKGRFSWIIYGFLRILWDFKDFWERFS